MAKRKTARTTTKKASKKSEGPAFTEQTVSMRDLNLQSDHFYVNHAEVSVNNVETRIAFADLRGPESIALRGAVVMSHLSAKRLSEALAKSLDAVESKYGPITVPTQKPS